MQAEPGGLSGSSSGPAFALPSLLTESSTMNQPPDKHDPSQLPADPPGNTPRRPGDAADASDCPEPFVIGPASDEKASSPDAGAASADPMPAAPQLHQPAQPAPPPPGKAG